MGQMQPRSNSVAETKAAIKAVENKQSGGRTVPDDATPSVEGKANAKQNQKKG